MKKINRIFYVILALIISSAQSQTSAALSWEAPLINTDGSLLTNLAGYIVYWGSAPRQYNYSVDVGDTTRYDISWVSQRRYFSVISYNNLGIKSSFSEEVFYETQLPSKPVPLSLELEPSVALLDTLVINRGDSLTLRYKITPLFEDGSSFGADMIDSLSLHIKDSLGVWSTPISWTRDDTSLATLVITPGIYKIGVTYWVSGMESAATDKYFLDVRNPLIIISRKLLLIK